MEMERSVGSGGVLKRKSSSGCLIIKKKGVDWNSGGLEGLSDNSKEHNRARVLASSSSSSDEDESLELMRRKVNEKRLHSSSMGHKRYEFENRGNVVEIGGGWKRSRADLFDFDEYDEFDGKRLRNEHLESGFKMFGQSGNGNLKEFGVGLSNRNLVVDKRRQGSYYDSSSGGRSKGLDYQGARSKELELEDDDEAHMPISLLRLKCQQNGDKPIRLQGKNGVLKVMMNNRKKIDVPSQPKNYDSRDLNEGEGSRLDDSAKKEILVQSPKYATMKLPENHGLFSNTGKGVEKVKKEKKSERMKPTLDKGIKTRDLEVEGTKAVLKMVLSNGQTSTTKKVMKKQEEEKSLVPENFNSIQGKDGKEGKTKRGGSTEKQMLREKIRRMLVDAGWTIDYRPRRNREYLDAVYINPSGTAYWSIIKAYDALKKQLEEDNSKSDADVAPPSFAPIAEDLINKLTRQTKKKIEEDMKRKRKEDDMTKSAKRSALKQAADSSDSDQNEEHLRSYMKQNCKNRSENFGKVEQDDKDDLPKRKPGKLRVEKSSAALKSNVIQGRTSKVIGRCTLLVRSSDQGVYRDSDGYVPYRGKRTVLAWLINSGTAQLSEKVQYMKRKRARVLLEGWITRDGIHCGCCSKILTVSKFELHAGSKLRQPFQNIFLESGSSLLQCQIDAWNSQDELLCSDFHTVNAEGDDPDDDTCGICGDGGDLICCDSCPSTFHQICLEIQVLPKGDWHCPSCTCKFCGHDEDVTEENDDDSIELSRCSFCEKKYHKSCSENAHAVQLPLNLNGLSFCGPECHEIYEHLQKNLGIKHELDAGFSWSLIQRTDVSDALQRGFAQRVECNSKLAVALSIMDECFLPIIDRRSGLNIVNNVVYNCGSNFNRLNFCGFYTAILERGDEIVSAASIRLHGTSLAEMPFIGTREMYRRKGMCRRLLSAIETELRSLKVIQLIIPAITEHMSTWTTVFGFHKLEDVHRREIKLTNMLVFPGTDMLQKQLMKHKNSGGTVSKSANNQALLHVLVENSKMDSSMEQTRLEDSDSGGYHESKTGNKNDASDFTSNDDEAVRSSNATLESHSIPKPEVENKQRESSPHQDCSPEQLLDTSVAGDACETEAPNVDMVNDLSLEAINAAEARGSPAPFTSERSEPAVASEDVAPPKIKNNGCIKSFPGSVSEISASMDGVNQEPDHGSCAKTSVNEQPLESESKPGPQPSTKPPSGSTWDNDKCQHSDAASENISEDPTSSPSSTSPDTFAHPHT